MSTPPINNGTIAASHKQKEALEENEKMDWAEPTILAKRLFPVFLFCAATLSLTAVAPGSWTLVPSVSSFLPIQDCPATAQLRQDNTGYKRLALLLAIVTGISIGTVVNRLADAWSLGGLRMRASSVVSATSIFLQTAILYSLTLFGLPLQACLSVHSRGVSMSRVVAPLRYVYWATTTPSMVVMVGRLAQLDVAVVASAARRQVLVIVFGFLSQLFMADKNVFFWFFLGISFYYFFRVVGVLAQALDAVRHSDEQTALDAPTRKLVSAMATGGTIAWFAFPAVWMIAAFNLISPSAETVCWAVLDTSSKIFFTLVWLTGDFRRMDTLINQHLIEIDRQRIAADDSNQVKRKFMRYIFHELRVPLNALSLGLEDVFETFSEFTTYIEEIKAAAASADAKGAVDQRSRQEAGEGLAGVGGDLFPSINSVGRTGTHARYTRCLPPSAFQALRKLQVGTTAMQETLEMLMGNALAMAKLLDDFLSLEKIEEGKFELEMVAFRPSIMVAEAVRMFAPPCQAKQLTITVQVDEDVPESMVGDVHKLRQVLCNYISNAIKFSREGGVIAIRVMRASIANGLARAISCAATNRDVHVCAPNAASGPDTITFTVADTGPGISEEDQTKLFQPFNQIKAGAMQKGHGTGLGLSICKRIVELSGGCVGCESSVGKGSTFFFQVPIGRPELWQGYDAGAASAPAAPGAQNRVVSSSISASMFGRSTTSVNRLRAASSPDKRVEAQGGQDSNLHPPSAGGSPGDRKGGTSWQMQPQPMNLRVQRVGTPVIPTPDFSSPLATASAHTGGSRSKGSDASGLSGRSSILLHDRPITYEDAGLGQESLLPQSTAEVLGLRSPALATRGFIRATTSGRGQLPSIREALPPYSELATPLALRTPLLSKPESAQVAAAAAVSAPSPPAGAPPAAEALSTPATSTGTQPAPQPMAAATARIPAPLTHVVIVDDVKTNRELFGRMLQRRGVATVHYAEDGEQAVALLDTLPQSETAAIQCWFLDKEMPVCDGHECARRLRARGITAPIIGVTGNALVEDRLEFQAAGADAVLTKPVGMHNVEAELARFGLRLQGSGAARALSGNQGEHGHGQASHRV